MIRIPKDSKVVSVIPEDFFPECQSLFSIVARKKCRNWENVGISHFSKQQHIQCVKFDVIRS